MDQEDKRRFRERYERMSKKFKPLAERKRLQQESRRRRAGLGSARPRQSAGLDEDDEVPFEPMRRFRGATGGAAWGASAGAPGAVDGRPDAGEASLEEALVVSVARERVRLEADGGPLVARLDPRLLADPRTLGGPAVGDRVGFERLGPEVVLVRAVRPRSSVLARPDPADPRRRLVLAANVDVVVVVASWREPPFKPGLVDRVLIAAEEGGARGHVVVNKADLVATEAERSALERDLAPWRSAGVPVHRVSAATGEGLADLRAALAGATCAFVGHSGVGKSSLLNALDPAGARAIGSVRASDGKGRHTTSSSSLVDLGGGTRLVDTPGVRQFGLWELEPAVLASYFPELAALADACRFRDCTHRVEPDCAVRAGVQDGRVPRRRWETYLRILQ